MELQRGVFFAQVENDLGAEGVRSHRHPTKIFRHTKPDQRRDLFCQRLFQRNTSGVVLIILPWKTFWAMPSKGTSILCHHTHSRQF